MDDFSKGMLVMGCVAAAYMLVLAVTAPDTTKKYGQTDFREIQIENMPCIVATQDGRTVGVTCNWNVRPSEDL